MLEKFKERLRSSGQKVTAPRLAVFAFLQENRPTTIKEAVAAINGSDRASIYRALALFRELDIIHEIVAGGRRMIELTDAFDTHHHHLTCLSCGRHESIEDEAVERRLDQVAKARGFSAVAHQVEVSGLCSRCQR